MKRNKIIFTIFTVLVFVILSFLYYQSPNVKPMSYKLGDIKKVSSTFETFLPKVNLFINQERFSVEVARTDEEKPLGLGDRQGLNKNSGMLFVFEKPSKQHFWMKDMNFPIDIIWINKDKKITGFIESARPEDYPETYSSGGDVLYVLEIEADGVENHNIKIGDQAIFDLSNI